MMARKRLQDIPIFRFVDSSLASHLNECASVITKNKGQAFVIQDDPVPGLYVIDEGTAEVYLTNKGLAISSLGPGDVFGEMSLLEKEKASATIRASSDQTSCIFIEGKKFSRKLEELPELSASFHKGASHILSSRLRHVNSILRDELSMNWKNDSNSPISGLVHLSLIEHGVSDALNEVQKLNGMFEPSAESITYFRKLNSLLSEAKQSLRTLIRAFY